MADDRERELELEKDERVVSLRGRSRRERERGPRRQTSKARSGPGRDTVGRDRKKEEERDDVARAGTTRDRGADPLEPDSRSERVLQRNEVAPVETDAHLAEAELAAEREAARSQRLADSGVSSARTDRHVAESLRRDPGLESDAGSRSAYLEDEAVRKDVVSRGDQDDANAARADARAARAARSSGAPSLKNETTPAAATAGQPKAHHAAVAPSSTPVASKGRSSKGHVRSHSRKGQEK
jgi:hypothetical protein